MSTHLLGNIFKMWTPLSHFRDKEGRIDKLQSEVFQKFSPLSLLCSWQQSHSWSLICAWLLLEHVSAFYMSVQDEERKEHIQLRLFQLMWTPKWLLISHRKSHPLISRARSRWFLAVQHKVIIIWREGSHIFHFKGGSCQSFKPRR